LYARNDPKALTTGELIKEKPQNHTPNMKAQFSKKSDIDSNEHKA